MDGPAGATASVLRDMFVTGRASAREILQAHLSRIEATEPKVGAFLTVTAERAHKRAATLDRDRAAGRPPGALAGVPVAIKDVLCVRGEPTTCGSRILEGYRPPYDATCVRRLEEAGAMIVGKTNMDEFAMGSSTEHSAYGRTRNPWDLDRVPGGSSGGSAAAVAARQVPIALGTDTGGSIRQPAAFTGTVGVKPTYGRVSRYGLVTFASSLDQAGPFSRSVLDAALALSAMAGPDSHDMTCSPAPPDDYVGAASGRGRAIEGLRVGVPAEFFGGGLDPQVESAVRRCHDLLANRGARIEEVSLPTTEYAIATYYIVATAEASSNLARYDGVRYGHRDVGAATLGAMYERTRVAGFGPEVKRRIMLGTYALSAGYYDAYYLKAMKVRTLIRRDFERAFEKVDVLVGPTTPSAAFRFGEKLDDPLAMYLSDIYTVTANLSGVPGLSIPCGFTAAGLPIGCQLLGGFFDEATLFSVAAALEELLDLGRAAPAI
ncbi:MAG TPA: Asp-tRNA(Asn)/Glu-tRNA(Gln) amidotransferase subunit GatA [Candidatus Polarisedimenticolia bacterium]|nr:Asp-tRNA(Asn)/Glu-tRNA(Gln) amidotransferase subunit GatA [Candidatus Polarisedimenticolia bacterium]